MMTSPHPKWLANIKWDQNNLIPAIIQDQLSGKILMLAWMNNESLLCSLKEKQTVFWSRSRGKLWRKGEESGHTQQIKEIRLDCDNDTLLIKIEQTGVACHTGRESCFYQKLIEQEWETIEPVIIDPKTIYPPD